MIAVFIGWRHGHTLESLRDAAVHSVGSGIGAMFILLAVGSLIGTWAMSGTLVAMVYYGLQILSPNYFYVTAAATCAVVAASIGSSWTVVGTIGIGLMGIALNMDLNPGIAAAAIISGAYFGGVSWYELANGGLATEQRDGAIADADCLFASRPQPRCGSFF